MTRIQIEMSDEEIARIDKLMVLTGTRTRKEYFNNALTLMEWGIKEKQLGHGIASIEESTKSFRELVMPALEKVPPISESAVQDGSSGEGGRLSRRGAAQGPGLRQNTVRV
jgi:hypothetical protein